jgi:hypothetical protein
MKTWMAVSLVIIINIRHDVDASRRILLDQIFSEFLQETQIAWTATAVKRG